MPIPDTLSSQAGRLGSAARNLLAAFAEGIASPLTMAAEALRTTDAYWRAVSDARADVAAQNDAIWQTGYLGPPVPPEDTSPFTTTIFGRECRVEWIGLALSGVWFVWCPGLLLSCRDYTRADAIARMEQAIAACATQPPSEPSEPADQPVRP